MSNLMKASEQWRNRPVDERFQTLEELKTSVLNRRKISIEASVNLKEVNVIAKNDDIKLNYCNTDFGLTNWSFQQLCSIADAPAGYIQKLSPELAVSNLRYGIAKTDTINKLLISANGDKSIRALTSTGYSRIWDIDVVNAVEHLCELNPSWHNPPAYKVGSFGDKNGMENAGLYASDRDIFMFMVDEEHKIEVNGDFMSRGFFVWNSEVGKATFGITTFLYRYVCGNHIVWDAKQVQSSRVVHKGDAPYKAFKEVVPTLKHYIESSAVFETQTIKKAIEYRIADNEQDTITWLRNKDFQLSESRQAIEIAKKEEGSYNSLWNIVQGLTASARNRIHVDARLDLEKRAGKLLNLVS